MAIKTPLPPKSLGRQVNFTAGRINALCARRLEPYGLTLPQWVILSCLWREGRLSVSQIAELLGSRLPGTSRLIDRMSERGLIIRERDADDNRVMMIRVSEAGQALDHLSGFHLDLNEILLAGLDSGEREAAFTLLAKIEINARRALDEA